jgi:hypothetical protein
MELEHLILAGSVCRYASITPVAAALTSCDARQLRVHLKLTAMYFTTNSGDQD